MGYHARMKTTLDISDNLLRRAKAVARKKNCTLKELAEEGLDLALQAHESAAPYKVRPVVVDGKGLTIEFRAVSWEKIRETAYRGRG